MSILEFLLYLIYGFSMITMGIFAVMQKDSRLMNINLIKSLKYLGFFAIIHGMTEWITMIQKLELCHPYLVIEVHYTNMILKALSFVFLLHFGLDLLPVRDKYKSVLTWIPMAAFLAYLSGFFLLIWSQGVEYHLTNKMFNTIVIRYLLALPSCMTAAAALYFNARLIKITKSVEISHRYRNLALILIVYGLIEGLLVAKAAYFPANIIHNEIFPAYFSLMTLSFKAVAGFAINYLLIKVMDTFSWEQEARMQQLEQSRIAAEERRKMGLEIHDGIIQDLYAMGLKLEYLSTGQGSAAGRDILDEVKGNLSASIDKIRDCITSNACDEIQLDSLKDKLERLVQKYNGSQGIKIKLEYRISPYLVDNISPEKAAQIYYIVQEAVTNVTKHSQADHAEILLEGRHDNIYVTIRDNGRGFSQHDIPLEGHFGIRSMQERTRRVNGLLHIEKLIKGTRVEVKIPC